LPVGESLKVIEHRSSIINASPAVKWRPSQWLQQRPWRQDGDKQVAGIEEACPGPADHRMGQNGVVPNRHQQLGGTACR
jgi:hypothetical protein